MKNSRFMKVKNWEALSRRSRYSSWRLAAACEVTTRHLRRHFHEVFGLKLHDWLQELRLRDAKRLLSPRKEVKAVAWLLGYKQASHFSRAFRARCGMSPEAFAGAFGDDLGSAVFENGYHETFVC